MTPAGGLGLGGRPPHLQMVVILVGIVIVLAEEEVIVVVEEGIVIRTWIGSNLLSLLNSV